MSEPAVTGFLDEATNTISYIVADPATNRCAVIDSVLDFDQASGRTGTRSADRLIEFVHKHDLICDWIIDTHVHADHLTAAPYLRKQLGGRTAIGEQITQVQRVFSEVFNEGDCLCTDGSQFDHLFAADEIYAVGNIRARAIYTPGHTPACTSHLIGDALFSGDTLFMPDYGTARCDFPGGDAGALHESIQKLFELPDATRLFVGHDYLPEGRRTFEWETTVGEQKRTNIHANAGVARDDFVALRKARDATLSMPKLMLPSVQINIRAGELPPAESNGRHYLKLPIDFL